MADLAASPGVMSAAPYDIIACLLGSFSHMLTLSDAAACLRGAAALLARRGVLVLQLTHPRALFDGSAAAAARTQSAAARDDANDDDGDADDAAWEVPFWDADADGLHVCVQWGAPGDPFDPLAQVLHRTVSITAWDDAAAAAAAASQKSSSDFGSDASGSVPPAVELREVVPARLFTLPEIQLLAAAAGLALVGAHGDMDVDASPWAEDAHSLVVVLARAEESGDGGGGDAAAARQDWAGVGKQQR
jgi:hypothetical protein